MSAPVLDTPAGVLGWHFAADKLRDGRPLPKAGETLTHTGRVVPCESDFDSQAHAATPCGCLSRAAARIVARAHEGEGV